MDVLPSSEEQAMTLSSKIHLDLDNGGGGDFLSHYSLPAPIDFSLIKENINPCAAGSPISSRFSSQIKSPFRSNTVIENQSTSAPDKCVPVDKILICPSSVTSLESQEPRGDDGGGRNIDSEIEVIEKEICRLSLRLEYLRLEKANKTTREAAKKRGRFVPATILDPPPSPPPEKQNRGKIEESISAKKTMGRSRGVTMTPSEIVWGLTPPTSMTPVRRRGVSLGPSEIYSTTKSRQLGNQQEITPVYLSQSRRKSCFWKLEEVDELKRIKETGKSVNLSAKSQKTDSKLQTANVKQAATTLKSAKNKSAKNESIQPKKLFKNANTPTPAKKSTRCERVVASRYNQISFNSSKDGNGNSSVIDDVGKRSLPDNDKKSKMCDRKLISFSGKSEQVSEIGPKRMGDNPNENPVPITKLLETVPRIRTPRCVNESPRDSGAVKKVSELVRRGSYFSSEEEEDDDACQTLIFRE